MTKKHRSDPDFYDELVKLVKTPTTARSLTRGPIPPEYPEMPPVRRRCVRDEGLDQVKRKPKL